MDALAILFLIANAFALLVVPARWAPMPLLLVACYTTPNLGFNVGPFSFTAVRALIMAGFVRVMVRCERPSAGGSGLDWILAAWAIVALLSGFFREEQKEALIFRLGLVYNVLGIYFLIRCFCKTIDDLSRLIKLTALVLVPVALEMVNEIVSGRNLFGALGGGQEWVVVRDSRVRARGPFAHPIFAGTVGAICLPLMVGLWRRHRRYAVLGVTACLLMVITSNSSGPLMSAMFSVFGLVLWHWRHLTRRLRVAAVIGYVLLDIVMKAPAYYLIARIDLTGGSTGWHRARLIESSLEHLDEWWLVGTDYTRHWMPTGVSWSPNHTDITNYYLKMGVMGGLPLMLLLITAYGVGFSYIGRCLRLHGETGSNDKFLVWCLGVGLFSHAASSISVSYFDQSYLFLYLTLGIIASLYRASLAAAHSTWTAEIAGTTNPLDSTARPVLTTAFAWRGK